jgi:hypothetical protein
MTTFALLANQGLLSMAGEFARGIFALTSRGASIFFDGLDDQRLRVARDLRPLDPELQRQGYRATTARS